MTILTTARLRLEAISDHHFDGLFKMNSQPEVMQYITGKPETPAETRAMIERVKARWIEYGFSWWSFIETDSDEIIGAGCIQHLGRDPANPLEIGWRLRKDKWGMGYASEAAQAMAAFAFDKLEADSLYAVCHQDNHGSAHVMKKLGMQYRGTERWYEMDTAVWSMDKAAWITKE
ncbi:GNAT family N-acetyltransferase [Iodobacter sp. LRB]|uniref:GNAT family N-acetyltransferase n=1 Tax=unclassified Iodobacter TaxID=235634 RepID=UPI000C0F75D3|nr:GNAT family N-acetyltransferase [Iodobacter sp. BJB302]PHU99564.1 N-acetyltransferase [Iodobacter sp. BJB302]